ncbi:hypothetical protein MAR_017749 [Mya arenaria]|uniref:Uncharacterized protein n=1 Tax=Mya arenaria TaxID=6604 RepID=A0ABY7EG70_MYAAR|nr:hypothetical protein MAR_017749 [Mya arenaria]
MVITFRVMKKSGQSYKRWSPSSEMMSAYHQCSLWNGCLMPLCSRHNIDLKPQRR